MITCTYDSGSATGCRPLCADPATHAVSYRNGSGPSFQALVCRRHLLPTEGRVYPGLISTERL